MYPDMSSHKSILKSAGVIGIITILSRILGLVRDSIIGSVLGAGYINDCFQIAFEIPHLTRRVLGEGALSAFIVPIYSKRRHQKGDESAWRFLSNALNVFFVITLVITVLSIVFSGYLFMLFGGLKYAVNDEAQYLQLGINLTRIMLPYVMFLALASILMGVLHSHRHFTTPALGSVVLNLTIIAAGLWFLGVVPERFSYILAIAVMVGVVLRVAIMIPPLLKRGFRYALNFDLKDPQLRDLARMMIPALFGLAIVQINISVDLNFANWMGPGTPTFIRFSNRLLQFPLAIFVASLSTAILPALSRKVIEDDSEGLRSLVDYALKFIIVISIPASVGLIVLGKPIIEIIFERGRWTSAATSETYFALIFYALGLLPIAAHRILTPVYYAREDLITPMKTASIGLVTNIVLNFIFYHTTNLNQGGLALATSISATINCAILYLLITRRYGAILDKPALITFIKTFICSIIMGAGTYGIYMTLRTWLLPESLLLKVIITLLSVGTGIIIYLTLAHLAGLKYLKELRSTFIRKKD